MPVFCRLLERTWTSHEMRILVGHSRGDRSKPSIVREEWLTRRSRPASLVGFTAFRQGILADALTASGGSSLG
jgi:hypothetical protein